MRTFLATTLFLFLLVPQLLEAEEPPPRAESFATFWADFKSAVARNDKEAVAAATKLPFMAQQSKADFIRDYPSYFTKEVKKCLATAKPVKATDRDTYSVFCGEEIFGFEKVNGAYKFTSIGMND